MRFKSKLRKIGNSQGVYIPLKVITDYIIGDDIELEVITNSQNGQEVITDKQQEVITNNEPEELPVITNWKNTGRSCFCRTCQTGKTKHK